MKYLARYAWLAMSLLVLLAGCGGGGGGGSDLSQYDAEIDQSYAHLQSAIEREDSASLSNLVSLEFLQDGTNDTGFVAAYQSFFDSYNDIRMDYTIVNINYDSDHNPVFAQVTFDYVITGINPATGQRTTLIDTTRSQNPVVMYWRFESGAWRMYGNQVGAKAQSLATGFKAVNLLGTPRSANPHSPVTIQPRR